MKNYLYLICAIFLLFFAACSDDDDDVVVNEDIKIKLTASKTSFLNDNTDYVEFKLMDSNDNDITESAEFFVNDEKIGSNKFSSNLLGDFDVYGTYQDIKSNYIKLSSYALASYKIKVNKNQILNDNTDQIEISLFDYSTNTDYTGSVDFFVGTDKLEANIFKTSTEGSFELKALIEGEEVAKVYLYAFPKFAKRNLVEDYTGQWCGYCPELMAMLDKYKDNYSIVPISVHSDDDMEFSKVDILIKDFNVNGFPTAILNRKTEINYTYEANGYSTADIALGLSTKYESGEITVDAKVYFDKFYTEQLNIVVYLMEEKVKGYQTNYLSGDASYQNTRFYALGGRIEDFEHNHVLRYTMTDLYGDNISKDYSINMSDYSVSFKLSREILNIDNWTVVAFVAYDEDSESKRDVLNAQVVSLGQSVNY
ncbi:MAG: Omp28-related outer membrane protein [Marinifilaceae bacterium]|jgi:thiol-disulfide isomerase/thioredoxin|nr:Omp28-related outer membrane protein [Marinifilaceae bacterium]